MLKALNGLRAGFKEAVVTGLAWIVFVPLWPYVFVVFWKKVIRTDRVKATRLAVGGIACDIAIAVGFQLDNALIAVVASIAYGVLTWRASLVQMNN